jgi:hypothetical protein
MDVLLDCRQIQWSNYDISSLPQSLTEFDLIASLTEFSISLAYCITLARTDCISSLADGANESNLLRLSLNYVIEFNALNILR